MSDELDYMSDEFIKNCVDSTKDVRPGLIKTHRELRQHQLIKKKNTAVELKKKPTEVLQVEVLEESLKQPINSTNKGFSMLEKMGFKTGMGLGKNNSGIKEPLGINIKKDKVGLGHKTSKRQKKCENNSEKINEDDFRAFLSKKNREREILIDFRKSQRICKELDLKFDKSEPQESWFWPDDDLSEPKAESTEKTLQDDDGDNDDKLVELSDAEKLNLLTKYLRENYYYCVWCKVQYCDEKDMEDCPGATRDDH